MSPVYADHPFALIPTPIYQGTQQIKNYESDMFERTASGMACVHNMVIRGLNSIYLQAPHVSQEDTPSFLQYCLLWYRLIDVHHNEEEKSFFPKLNQMTGEVNAMDENVKQHEAFHDGIEDFRKYLEQCVSGKLQFDGIKLTSLIDAFGSTITQHLADEITSLIELRRFGEDRMSGLEALFDKEGESSMGALGLTTGLSWSFFNHDVAYEDGLWAQWPPAPKLIVFLCRNVFYYLHSSWWKFASCDQQGRMRPLYAVPRDS